MQCFQKCLNRCGLNSPGLQMFIQCFQGYYRDQTDGGRECRYFATVYPVFRIASFVMYSITHDITFCFKFPVIVTLTLVFVSLYKQPYQKYNKLDFVMIMSSSYFPSLLWFISLSGSVCQWNMFVFRRCLIGIMNPALGSEKTMKTSLAN